MKSASIGQTLPSMVNHQKRDEPKVRYWPPTTSESYQLMVLDSNLDQGIQPIEALQTMSMLHEEMIQSMPAIEKTEACTLYAKFIR